MAKKSNTPSRRSSHKPLQKLQFDPAEATLQNFSPQVGFEDEKSTRRWPLKKTYPEGEVEYSEEERFNTLTEHKYNRKRI